MTKFDPHAMMHSVNNRVKFLDVDPEQHSVYTIGDIHGCYYEMVNLVDQCTSHAISHNKTPMIILLGDIIDRGPGFIEIFDYIKKNDIKCILGNHELNFYLESLGVIECRSRARRQNHILFETYGEDVQNSILETIGNMPNSIIIEFTNPSKGFDKFVLSHSPVRSIEHCPDHDEAFDIVRMMNGPQCSMRSEPVDFARLSESFDGIMMVHGHQSWNFKPIEEQNEEQKAYSNRVINVDSGCVYGDMLTALCLNTNEFLAVKATKAYSVRH